MNYKFDDKNHIHLLDGSPLYGTSTVIKEVMPPFLAKWGAQCAVDYVRAHRLDSLQVADVILNEAVTAYTKVLKEAAQGGTDLHAELEKYVMRMITDFAGKPELLNDAEKAEPAFEKVQKFAEWSRANVDTFIFAEQNTFSKSLWVGGIVDCLARMKDGSLAVIDFKSSREAYFNQFVQAAGYALQLEESGYGNTDGSGWHDPVPHISKLIVVPFGGKVLKPEVIENVTEYKKVFESVVHIYAFLNSFKDRKNK